MRRHRGVREKNEDDYQAARHKGTVLFICPEMQKNNTEGVRTLPRKIAKSYEIRDAKISFVSLVDKAANKHEFLIVKSEGNKANFQTYGRILKADAEKHYVTGIVYEPMVEDTDGNYMTEDEIMKAAHWFMKNAGDADIQHCFEKAEGVEVVESYVAKSDMEIEGQPIKKGTWLMTMEVTNDEVWDAIEKGDITGFSMGGKGTYSTKDVDITDPDNPVEKGRTAKPAVRKAGCGNTAETEDEEEKKNKKGKGILKQFASLFGMDVVEKGAVEKGKVKDRYKRRIVEDNFWAAFYSLSGYLLETYNPDTGYYEPVHDEAVIRDALADFNEIVIGILADEDGVYEAIEKAGKKISAENKKTLQAIYENLGTFLSKFDDDDNEEEEDEELTKNEIESIVTRAVQKAMAGNDAQAANSPVTPETNVVKGEGTGNGAHGGNEATEGLTAETIEKMVQDAIRKQMEPEEEHLTMDDVRDIIDESVRKAMEPVLKNTGIPSNDDGSVQKDSGEQHYLHGFI